jgi:hypothetical protein
MKLYKFDVPATSFKLSMYLAQITKRQESKVRQYFSFISTTSKMFQTQVKAYCKVRTQYMQIFLQFLRRRSAIRAQILER